MKVPQPYLDLLLSGQEPGQIYRQCLQRMQADGADAPTHATQEIVYGCEVNYAIQVLTQGGPDRLYNFGDLDGRGTPLIRNVVDPLESRRVLFLGAGPYPVTAFLIRERYPDSQVTCVDNDLVSFLLGSAVGKKMDPSILFRLGEAHDYDCSGFDLVVVAAMVNDRENLARRLVETTEAELIVRGDLELQHPRLHTVASTFDERGALKF